MYKKNEFTDLECDTLCGNGNAIARDKDGFVFFVRNGVPGDFIRAKIIKITKNYGVAIIDEFYRRSEKRIDGGCEYFEKCGGCVFQNISYEDECSFKKSLIDDDIRHIGGFDISSDDFIAAAITDSYRNKAIYPVSLNKDRKIISGYYAQNSHRICEHDYCMIGNPLFVRIRDHVCRFCEENNIPVYDEISGKGILRHIYIRSAADGSFVLTLILRSEKLVNEKIELRFVSELVGRFPGCVSVLINVNKENTNSVLGKKWRKLYGDGYLYDELLGKKFRISPASFYQVYHDQAEKLYTIASELAAIKNGETVLDLYCGTGTIGICLAKKGCKLYGVEITPQAVTDAEYNAARNNVDAEFICLDAGEALNSERIKNISPDIIILDPPRKGCGGEAVERIASFDAERIVYISCDPATLSRDLKTFSQFGYLPTRVIGVDMFPRTGHVETVVLLSKELRF